MPEFKFKDGNIGPDFLDYIQNNEKETIYITADIETDHIRLRGAFHALLGHWFDSGCYSCQWNERPIRTLEGLKKYYKYWGCDGKAEYYSFGVERSKDKSFFLENLPESYHRFIVPEPRPWEKMTKKQKCRALSLMISEIKHAEEIPRAVEISLNKLEQDREALMTIGYYNYVQKYGRG
jgi:hypothetical protein